MSQIVIIPARLKSTRFPNKILLDIKGIPMVEHVRRRVLLSQKVKEVFVATCDEEIRKVVESFGGRVIMTSNLHLNGTTRVAEAVQNIDCTEVVLVQGDEPLLLPRHLDLMIDKIENSQGVSAWNATGPIESEEELMRHSYVKCAMNKDRILYFFRKSPSVSEFKNQKGYIRKALGVIAYKKEFLMQLTQMKPSAIETFEQIEQMRIIENGFALQSIPFESSQPSINEPSEVNQVLQYIDAHLEQQQLLDAVLNFR